MKNSLQKDTRLMSLLGSTDKIFLNHIKFHYIYDLGTLKNDRTMIKDSSSSAKEALNLRRHRGNVNS